MARKYSFSLSVKQTLLHYGLVCCFFAPPAFSFSEGPPDKSCFTLYPKHDGLSAQASDPPYQVLVNATSYNATNQAIGVTLRSDPGHFFKGFMLLANRVWGNEISVEDIVGHFVQITSDKGQFLTWYPQDTNRHNCLAHKNSNPVDEITAVWISPDPVKEGDVVFRASFLNTFEEFWVDVRSSRIKTAVRLDAIHEQKVNTVFGLPNIHDGCGSSKGCLKFPRHCSGSYCTRVITWTPSHDSIKFEMLADTPAYVAMAISKDRFMGDDHAVACVSSNNLIHIQNGYNPAYFNERHMVSQFTNVEIQRSGGRLYCSWVQPYVVNISLLNVSEKSVYPKTFNYKQSWHIQMAWGGIYYGGDTLQKHKEYPVISDGLVQFTNTEIVLGSGMPLAHKIHAFLMMVAWILFSGVGVVTARYLKRGISEKIVFGTKVWFQVHRAVMITCAVLAGVAFIIIFSSLRKWSTHNYNHAVVGTIAMVLLFLQLLGGFLRPGLQSKIRPVFNWAHWLLGKSTQILAAVTILLSLNGSTIHEQMRTNLTVVFSAWIGFQILFEFAVFEVFKFSNEGHAHKVWGVFGTKEYKVEVVNMDDASHVLHEVVYLRVQLTVYLIAVTALLLAASVILFLY